MREIFASLCSQLQAEENFKSVADYLFKISTQLSKSSHDTSPYRFMFKFEVKYFTRRDSHRENAKLKKRAARQRGRTP
ncbi:hypothetical protein CSUNSWCD_441 [Campylobacter showae CSUNSWCD]|uniref:Uncharacterized protein n=1 Tax=Campylobacter showae CSUNSWCD TaxID=1244083 RepID=M5ISH9_9BACT|nr:hypothetical protein CSUNSWCD_441 [Campylobacter showae CSUNSWCD]